MPDRPDTLAKFCTAHAAEQILESNSLRWHAPHLLGDPFELTHQSQLSFEPSELLDSVIRAAAGMIFARKLPLSDSSLVTVIRRWRDEERFDSIEEAEEVLTDLMSRMVDQRQSEIDALMADWRRYTRQLRICTFSERTDNLPCWQRYADNHRGAVLRLRCGEGTTLADPKPVTYQNNRPEICNLKDHANAILFEEGLRSTSGFLDKFLVKSRQAKDEQEWRCFYDAADKPSTKSSDDRHWYDDRPFEPDALMGVYFGAFMLTEHKQKLLSLVEEKYPDARVYQAKPVPGAYDIEFVAIRK